jgi:hypothetical protein
VSTSETVRGLLAALAAREPRPPEHAIELTTTTIRPAGEKAYRVHNWTVTIRGGDPEEADRLARRIDDGLAAKYGHELDADTLAGDLARSVTK